VPAAAAPVPGEQDTALAQVPANAPLVFQLRGFERARERLNGLVKNAMPEFAAIAKTKLDEHIKNLLQERELKGITKDGPVFVVFTDLAGVTAQPPKMAILVPVAKYETFRDGLLKDDERKGLKADPAGYEVAAFGGESIYFVNRKNGYVVVSPDPDVAASFAKKYDGLAGRLGKHIARELMDADLSVYADLEAVNKQYGDALKQLHDTLDQAIEQAPDKNSAEMAKRVFGPAFQGLADSKAVVASADLRPEGLLLHVEVEVAADSTTSTALKEWKSLPLADLRKLPAGLMAYTGMAYTPALLKNLMPLQYGLTAGADSEQDKALLKTLAELADAGPRWRLDAMDVPLSGLQVWKYDDPAKAAAAQLKLFKNMKEGSTYGSMLKGNPVIKEGAQKYGDFEFHAVSLKWDLEKMLEKQAAALTEAQKQAMAEYFKGLLGEGVDLWFGTDGKVLLQVMAKDWPAARALVDAYQKGERPLGDTQAFKDAAKHLPANGSALMLMDVPQYAELIAKVGANFVQQMGLPLSLPPGFEKPAVKGQTSYLGFGIALEPGRGTFDMWLAASSVHDVYKMYLERLLTRRDF
jgi:hypothetical protein